MRADRLLSLLMLLQTRGQMTAKVLAQALEVSERTIYRDIDALSASGVPVYGEAGPAGGYGLLDSYRTTLTGLTEGEVRALFMVSIPAPLAALGVTQELKTALLKLTAALPVARRQDEARVRQRFYLDSTWWQQGHETIPHLQTIHQAVWQDRKLRLTYRPLPTLQLEQIVEPYGLVAKAGIWYVVCAQYSRIRVHRVADLLDARLCTENFIHPADFDLERFWTGWCTEQEERYTAYTVHVRIAPDFIAALPIYFGDGVRAEIAKADPPDATGHINLTLSFASLEAARSRLLAFGRGVEVLQPLALRKSLVDFAEQTVAIYTTSAR